MNVRGGKGGKHHHHENCEVCAKAKAKRTTRWRTEGIRASRPGEVLAWDVVGPFPRSIAPDSHRFATIIIDLASGHVWSRPSATKTSYETVECLKQSDFSPDPRNNPEAAPLVKKFKAAGIETESYVLYTYDALQVFDQAATQKKKKKKKKVLCSLKY